MAPALAATNRHDRAGLYPKASPYAASSQLAAIDAHQRERAATRALSRGHVVHVDSNQTRKGSPDRSAADASPQGVFLKTRRGSRLGAFSRISHRLGVSLPTSRLVAECAFAGALAITNSTQAYGSRRCLRHTPTVQLGYQAIADRELHRRRLSSSPSSAGSKTSWKALTDAEILFDAGSNSND